MVFRLLFIGCLLMVLNVHAQQPIKDNYAPPLALPTLGGDTANILLLKGKVVLVDFWASWCYTCRVLNGSMTKLYADYNTKGFEIISVSLDFDSAKWKKAVLLDKMTWPQANPPGTWHSPLVQAWAIHKLPSSFLINQQGVIVALDPSYGVIKAWLKELLPSSNL